MNTEKIFITSSGKFIYQENGILRCYPLKKLRMEAKRSSTKPYTPKSKNTIRYV